MSIIHETNRFLSDWIIHIHNLPLQLFSQDYELASHTARVMCINFMREWRYLQLNVNSEQQIYGKLFQGRVIYAQSVWQKSTERELFSFSCLARDTKPVFMPTHCYATETSLSHSVGWFVRNIVQTITDDFMQNPIDLEFLFWL